MQKGKNERKGNNISVTQRVLDKFGDNAIHGRQLWLISQDEYLEFPIKGPPVERWKAQVHSLFKNAEIVILILYLCYFPIYC